LETALPLNAIPGVKLESGRCRRHDRFGNSIRRIAINRKNALFAGSDEGGTNRAIIASLVETCKLISVNPHAWLADILTRLVNRWPTSCIDDLTPWTYAKILARRVNLERRIAFGPETQAPHPSVGLMAGCVSEYAAKTNKYGVVMCLRLRHRFCLSRHDFM